MTTTILCQCGRRMLQYANRCRKCSAERSARIHAETLAVVLADSCPQCGSAIRRNSSLTGWFQCEQYGADSHRARPLDPQCSWQGFTE